MSNSFYYITDSHIQKNKQIVTEGQFRAKELKEYLDRIDAPKKVFLSEDGSGIAQKVVYDVNSNQLVGLLLPLQQNGCPKTFSYLATSEEEIRRCMTLPKSTLAYIIVAQPLKRSASPFILQVFGTDNKFKSSDVKNRWAYMETELKKYIVIKEAIYSANVIVATVLYLLLCMLLDMELRLLAYHPMEIHDYYQQCDRK